MIGICGKEKKSDALVSIDLNTSGISVEIVSKLKNMYGHLMKQAVIDVLSDFNISDAKVIIKDFGALDFVIKARTKTALKRAIRTKGCRYEKTT